MELGKLFRRRRPQHRESILQYMISDLGMELTQTITIPRVFLRIVSAFGSNVALMEKQGGDYQSITYAQVCKTAYAFAAALIDLGLSPKDKIALFLKNSPEWVYADLGTMFAGCITVPIYETLSLSVIKHILKDSGSSVIVAESQEHYQKILGIKRELPALKHIIVRKVEKIEPGIEVYAFNEFLEKGKEVILTKIGELNSRLDMMKRDDVASIIYTSGTTGNPKGVMLTHRNFLSNVYGIISVSDLDESNTYLSILPLSHAFERTVGYYCALLTGACIAYSEGIKKFDQNLLEIRPTICCVVPLILEKMYDRICDNIKQGSPIRRLILDWAISRGEKMEKYRKEVTKKGFGDRRYRHRPENLYASPVNTFLSAPLLTILHFIADQLVYKKIRQKMGGRIHHFVAGGAPLSADIINFFKYLNVTIYEGYGMTETSPVISFNYRGSMKPGTTGKLLPNVQVKFSAEGEILVKGPNVMLGYHNNPAATAQLINSEGWLHTGDMGKWDDGNYLKITGRLKDLIVLSTGKNVPLLPIEDKLKRFPLVTNVVVVGNNRKFITALIFANLTEIESLAKMKGISTTNPDELCNHEEIEKEFSEIIEKVNHGFSPYEQIKKFAVVAHNIGEDPELVTPTLKIKRGMVEKKFADIIEKMYQ